MFTPVKFSEAFLFEPPYGIEFMLRGAIYEYRGMIVDDGNVVVIAVYYGKNGSSYRVFPMSDYADTYVSFL